MQKGGIANLQEIITQLTYPLSIRLLDDREFENENIEELTNISQLRIFPQNEEDVRCVRAYSRGIGVDDMLVEIRDHFLPFVEPLKRISKMKR